MSKNYSDWFGEAELQQASTETFLNSRVRGRKSCFTELLNAHIVDLTKVLHDWFFFHILHLSFAHINNRNKTIFLHCSHPNRQIDECSNFRIISVRLFSLPIMIVPVQHVCVPLTGSFNTINHSGTLLISCFIIYTLVLIIIYLYLAQKFWLKKPICNICIWFFFFVCFSLIHEN